MGACRGVTRHLTLGSVSVTALTLHYCRRVARASLAVRIIPVRLGGCCWAILLPRVLAVSWLLANAFVVVPWGARLLLPFILPVYFVCKKSYMHQRCRSFKRKKNLHPN